MEILIVIVICVAAYFYFRKPKGVDNNKARELASYATGLGNLVSATEDITNLQKGFINHQGIYFYYACLLRCCRYRNLSKETLDLVMHSHFLAHGVDFYARTMSEEEAEKHMNTLLDNLFSMEETLENAEDSTSVIVYLISDALKMDSKKTMLSFKGLNITLAAQQFLTKNVSCGLDIILKMNNLK